MDRRGFLGAILAAGVAPAVVKIGSLMAPRAIAPERFVYSDHYGLFARPSAIWPGVKVWHENFYGPNDLSERALEDAIIAIRSQTDARGKYINVIPTKLMIPASLHAEWDRHFANSQSGITSWLTGYLKA